MHSDLYVLELFADRCQVDMTAFGVLDAAGADEFRLRDAMAECRQMLNLFMGPRLEDIMSHQFRATKYPRVRPEDRTRACLLPPLSPLMSQVDLIALYYLLLKYKEPPGLAMLDMKARFGREVNRVPFPKKKDADHLAQKLLPLTVSINKTQQALRADEEPWSI